ncbi:MAG: alpha/beta hydrolase [Nitrososphaerota archaeon]|nr:alpha/beta hydrolase [Nitrososphaerota archaeon]
MQTQADNKSSVEERPAHDRRKLTETGLANINGININYRSQGDGEPLFMISGFGSSQGSWWPQTRIFKKHYRVITFDNLGVGKSDKPEGPYSTKMMAKDATGLMDYLSIQKAHVLGASMGGMIAQELAINYPDRVNKLVLACTFAARDETGGPTAEGAKAKEIHGKPLSSSAHMIKYSDNLSHLIFSRLSFKIFVAPLMMLMSRFARPSAAIGLSGQLDAILAHDTIDRLKQIQAPTLVITGTQDRLIKPASSEVLARLIPKAKLVKIEGGSHTFSIEMSSQFNREVLNFLEN